MESPRCLGGRVGSFDLATSKQNGKNATPSYGLIDAQSVKTCNASEEPGYRDTAVEFVETTLQLKLHISTKSKDAFAVLPIRWIVERTLAWLGNFRRLSKDYEILTDSAENMVRIAMIQITLTKGI